MKILRVIIYLSIGLIIGSIIGWLFAESMHFYDTGFAILYFGTVFALISYGLLSSIYFLREKDTNIFSNLAIFFASCIGVILIFVNFKGYAVFFLDDINLLAIWLINISMILIFGLIGFLLDKIFKKKI